MSHAAETLETERSFEPLPPHNTEAEECVLGSLLIDPEAIEAVAPMLRPADFYHPRNRDVYGAMLRLFERRQPTDFVMVCDELERTDRLDGSGGVGYLSHILTVVPTSMNVAHYAQVVERTAIMRRLIAAAGRIAAIGYDDQTTADAALSQAAAEIAAVGGNRTHATDPVPLGVLLVEYLEQIHPAVDPVTGELQETRARIPTGFIDLDRLLGGFGRSDLIVLAARPGLGKTALGLTIARNLGVRFQLPCLIFSVEMSRWQIAARFLAMQSTIDATRLREGRLAERELAMLSQALDELSAAPVFVDDTPAISMADLRAKARAQHEATPLGLVIVDYLQLVRSASRGNRVEQVSELSAALKQLARELDVPVLALSQLSRAVESRSPHIPQLSDLRESGGIEQDSDVVVFIYREDVYDRETERKGIAELHIAKHRNGPTGICSLLWAERLATFGDLGPHGDVPAQPWWGGQ